MKKAVVDRLAGGTGRNAELFTKDLGQVCVHPQRFGNIALTGQCPHQHLISALPRGSRPPVVLVHGFGLDMRMWTAQLDHLVAAVLQVVRYDCRGFGASGPLDSAVPYTHSSDLIALLDHLAIDDAVLVGLSFGGQVVLRTALLAPSRVRALGLLDSVLDGVRWDPASKAALDELAQEVRNGGVPAGRRAWLNHPLFAAARERVDLTSQLTTMVDDYPGQHWLGLDPHHPEPPIIDRLRTITAPTLLVAGDLDVPCFLEMADILAARIPGAEHYRIPGSGHMVNMEQPATVNRLIAGFVHDHYRA